MEGSEVYLLTRTEALQRSNSLSSVHYCLKLTLSPSTTYSGIVQVTVLVQNPSNLWLDFKGTSVTNLLINSSSKPISCTNAKLLLPDLVEGQNSIEVHFSNTYSNDGLGLHHFEDPEDQKVYIYTQCEPFSANRIFPCFDQPDLKSKLDLIVKVPESWTVISNEAPSKITKDYEGEMPNIPDYSPSEPELLHFFEGKYKISTYLYALCAGHYVRFEKNDNEVGIPISLYCRQSLVKYMVPERYFHWVIEGFKFYQAFFDYPYPFSKYDNVFVPEFLFGAMENVGCVTYRDQYIFKDPPSHVQLIRVCDTFLHEMAHMWFGDLVTMKWWDDLWLNESFATFMSSLAIDVQLHSEFPDAWMEFLSSKGWGYSTDQNSTTHPISTVVNDTNETETNFDGISYSKGSAVLKQLYFLVGDSVFKTAISRYFKHFEFANAEFEDLIRFIAQAARETNPETDIEAWANSWVKTAGLNELSIEIQHTNDLISNFSIIQTASLIAHPTLRNHSIFVEVFDSEMKSLGRHKVNVLAQEVTSIDCFNGLNAKAAILNVGDWGYCKIRIDEKSLVLLREKLHLIADPLSRQLVYRALWDMVRDTKLSGIEYLEFVIKQLPLENDSSIANYALEISSSALVNYIPRGAKQNDLAHEVFITVLDKIRSATPETAPIFQKSIKWFIYHPDDINLAVSWVQNKDTTIDGWTLGKLDRWSIIKSYSKITEEAKAIVEAEFNSDPSDTGKLAKLYCEAAFPNCENKERLWNNFLADGEKMSRYERAEVMGGFNVESQPEILRKYGEMYFESVPGIIEKKDREYSKDFCEMLVPYFMQEDFLIEKLESLIPRIPEERFDISRDFRETVDICKRTRAGKECSRKYLERIGG